MTLSNPPQIETITKALVSFGYTDLNTSEVREQADLITAGKDPTNIIGQFVKRMLEDSGLIEKTI